METNNPYDDLADVIVSAATGAPELKDSPEFMQHLRLFYTPKEARLVAQIGLAGGKLDELSVKTGIEKAKLKEQLNSMARKGHLWVDPGKEDPVYRSIGLGGPGLSETPFWAGIRSADTVAMARLYNKWKYPWVRHGFKNMRYAVPVWPGKATLPADALLSEDFTEVIKQFGHYSVSPCPCRMGHYLDDPGHHCRHIMETCMHFGDFSRWAVEHGMARELIYEGAVEVLGKASDDGLVTTCVPRVQVACNCCGDCCPLFIGVNEMGYKTVRASNFVSTINEETCNACGICAKRCPVKAIEVNGVASVNAGMCLGCGACVPSCKTQSAKLARRAAA